MDYRRPIKFGYFVLPDSMRPMRPLDLAVRAEELGIDLIGMQDHPYQRRFYDTWTLLTAVAMRTKRASVFPDVANIPLRPPAMQRRSTCSRAAASSSAWVPAVSGRRSRPWADRCGPPAIP